MRTRVAKAQAKDAAGERRRQRYQAYCAHLFGDQDTSTQESTEDTDQYTAMTLDELRAELKDRELATSGNKPDLVQRLRDNDHIAD